MTSADRAVPADTPAGVAPDTPDGTSPEPSAAPSAGSSTGSSAGVPAGPSAGTTAPAGGTATSTNSSAGVPAGTSAGGTATSTNSSAGPSAGTSAGGTATSTNSSAGPSAGTSAGGTATSRPDTGRRRLDPDTLAALEEQRDFLLRSLDDLERERAAGDIDEHDYEALKDDYTARAARTIRAIDSHRARVAAARRRPSWARRVATAVGVAAFAVLAGVLVADSAGRREAGESLTGDIRQSTREQLTRAVDLASQQRYDEAIDIYDDVLAEQPDNVEALTYKGWFQFLSGDSAGIDTLIEATETDPTYPDAHAFWAIILERAGSYDAALREIERLEELDPPPQIAQLVEGLRQRLEGEAEAEAGAGGDVPPATTAPGGPETSPTTAPGGPETSPTTTPPP